MENIGQCDVTYIMTFNTDKNNNINFVGLNIHYNSYHSLSFQTSYNIRNNVVPTYKAAVILCIFYPKLIFMHIQFPLFTEDKYNSIQTNGSPFDSDQDDRPGTGMICFFKYIQ
jgi:hypothetical protein